MKIAEIFDNLDTVNAAVHADLAKDGLEHMLIGRREISVVRWRKSDADYDWGKYDASILVGTPTGLIAELATEFSDLAEGWPARIDIMVNGMTNAIRAIAEQSDEIERTRDAIVMAAQDAKMAAWREGIDLEKVSVSLQRIWIANERSNPKELEVTFVIEIMMPTATTEIDNYNITVTDAEDLTHYFEHTLLPELRRRKARLAA